MATVLPVARFKVPDFMPLRSSRPVPALVNAPTTLAVPWVIELDRVEFRLLLSPIVRVTPAPL